MQYNVMQCNVMKCIYMECNVQHWQYEVEMWEASKVGRAQLQMITSRSV